ncbi:MAG: hypothetical protein ACLFVA_05605 [Dehalococcoidia bacterium]
MKTYNLYMQRLQNGVNFRMGGRKGNETGIDRYFQGNKNRWIHVGYIAAHDRKQALEDLMAMGLKGPRVYRH